MTLLRFAQSLIYAPSLCSVTNISSLTSLHHWGCSSLRFVTGVPLASLRCWGCSSLRFIAGGAPRFASLLGVLLTSLRSWGCSSLCFATFHSMVPSNCSKICILEGQPSNILRFGALLWVPP